MKHLKTTFAILISVFAITANAQEEKEEEGAFATFEINDARHNGEDVTESVIKDKKSYALYKIPESDTVQLAYLSDSDESQTYGPIYLVTKEITSDKTENNESVTYNFYWSYNFTEYIDRGTAKVKLLVFTKPQGKYFELSMKFENLEEYVFKGKIEGDLRLLDLEVGKTE